MALSVSKDIQHNRPEILELDLKPAQFGYHGGARFFFGLGQGRRL